ncbi:MAG: DUF4855 domain-containing protein [Ruminococcaceae bacterium]|nr:DUF4855 domain-containing protein [Oscillospiraceae bacterium]
MKKILSVVLVVIMLLSTASLFSYKVGAAMPSPSVIDGYENVCLTYTYRPEVEGYGRQEVADLMPYVAYHDINGNIKDFFFDSYLFLPCNTTAPSGATVHGGTNNPTYATDWIDYVNDTFYEGKNVDALDTAMGNAKQALGNTDKKAGVFFSILYPSYTQRSFGTLGGRSLNLSRKSDREYAIKWIIDEQIRLFNEAGYENLDMVGFYWLEETIYSSYDSAMLTYASNYLHSLGLKFIWIPYYQAEGYSKWQNYGFDLACLQPNLFWMSTPDYERVNDCATLCNKYGMSMQIEVSSNVTNSEYYYRYLTYLEGGINSGAMNSVKFYYQDGKPAVFYNACYSQNPAYRSVYDLTYKYAKGTLKVDDLDYGLAKDFELPEDVDWVSYGKSYTGCESYVDGNGMAYQEVDGKELTDGKFGTALDGTEWHAYHNSLLDSEGRMSSTIDLGEVRTDLTHFMAHFHNYQMYGIGIPTDIKLYTSVDGVNFEFIGAPELKPYDNISYFKLVAATPVKARYVKMSLLNSGGNFVFCSEFLVGVYTGDESSSGGGDTTEPHSHVANGNWLHNDALHWLQCECGQVINRGIHIKGNWVVTKEPTMTATGLQTKSCVTCKVVLESEVIPVLQYEYGDVDTNGQVDALDYMLLKRFYFASYNFDSTQSNLGDVNRNNEIDSNDCLLIKRKYFGTYN